MNDQNNYKDSILKYLKSQYAELFNFWIDKKCAENDIKIQDHCDIIYSFHLADLFDLIDRDPIFAFAARLNQLNLPFFNQNHRSKPLSIHNTAYLLGALNILRIRGHDLYPVLFIGDKKIEFQHLLDIKTNQPVYPTLLSHHIWRVSHWIGGIPSIIYSLMMAEALPREELIQTLNQTMTACDNLINMDTGLLKTYKHEHIQWFFRRLYRLRHHPDLGDIGGIAHLHWINYLLNRPYKGMEHLFKKSIKIFLERSPFMEPVPYCLDFDIIQIIRTCIDSQGASLTKDVTDRAFQMMTDIEFFLINNLNPEYNIHKLPGALAAYHECALISNLNQLHSFNCPPKDIIREAFWL